ncbi:hypothetical protein [Streptomyces sp. NPDC005303]|uniref:hypothetical protein n=1 Tax=Streptomyces sp. NPDC005303 TaxID=3155713 RepID=UPI0033B411BA
MHRRRSADAVPVRVGITGVGASLPDQVVNSEQLRRQVARTSGLPLPTGIFERATGILTRRVAAEGEYASTLAVCAARGALGRAGLDRSTSTWWCSPQPPGTWPSRRPRTSCRTNWAPRHTPWT